jgi:hypothetical protein
MIPVQREDEVEARDFLLDLAPFVDAPRPFEEERLRADGDRDILRIGEDIGLEREGALRPGEQEVDGLLDLVLQVLMKLFALQVALGDEDA